MHSCSTLIFGSGLGAWSAPGVAEARVARSFVGAQVDEDVARVQASGGENAARLAARRVR